VPKVHNKPIKRPRKGFKQWSKRQPGRHPGLAHRTVRCTTGQCPVHQGTRRPTLHLREFSEELAIIHRTVRCTTGQCPVPQGRATLNSPASGIRSAKIHRTIRCDSGATATSRATVDCNALNARLPRREAEHARVAHWTAYRVCPVHHRTARRAHKTELQRSNPNGLLTWLAHRIVSGAPCDCSLPTTIFWWLGL
jgi:hypothetical protein